jgi:hypothetical protein
VVLSEGQLIIFDINCSVNVDCIVSFKSRQQTVIYNMNMILYESLLWFVVLHCGLDLGVELPEYGVNEAETCRREVELYRVSLKDSSGFKQLYIR